MTPDHDRWADVAGAYVLGAMPAREREEFETHLATCAACQADVDELRPAAEALPMASPPMLPPAALKDRIMAEVEREAAVLAQAGPDADRAAPARQRRRFRLSLGGWQLAPVAAALLIVGALAGFALRGGDSTQTFSAGPNASVRVDGDKATFGAKDMQAPPEGRVYEMWVVPKGETAPRPTNVLFVPRGNGSAEAAIPGSASDIAQVLVSDEPPAGSDTPTGNVVAKAQLS
jgi:anti-sigma-K factor RskA